MVFVTTPFHTGVEDTRRSRRPFEETGVPALGCMVNTNGFVCDDWGADRDVFSERTPAEGLDMAV